MCINGRTGATLWSVGAPGSSEAKLVVRNGASVTLNGRLALGGDFATSEGTGRLVIGDAATAGYWTNRSTSAGSGNWLQIARQSGSTGIVDIVNGVFTGPSGSGFNDFSRQLPTEATTDTADRLAEINIFTNGTFITQVSWERNSLGEGRINFFGGTLQAEAGINAVQAADLLKANLPVYVHDGGAVVDNNGEDITLNAGLLNPGGSTGGLSLIGSGSTTLNGANTFAGPTLVQQGTLAGNGSATR